MSITGNYNKAHYIFYYLWDDISKRKSVLVVRCCLSTGVEDQLF